MKLITSTLIEHTLLYTCQNTLIEQSVVLFGSSVSVIMYLLLMQKFWGIVEALRTSDVQYIEKY